MVMKVIGSGHKIDVSDKLKTEMSSTVSDSDPLCEPYD